MHVESAVAHYSEAQSDSYTQGCIGSRVRLCVCVCDAGAHICEDDYFRCDNDRCIPADNICDNIDQCGNNTDEKHCECLVVAL